MAPDVSADRTPLGVDEALAAVVLLVGEARLDVTLPAHLPAAELVPEICSVLMRSGVQVPSSPVLAQVGGGPIGADATLRSHGVLEGDVLVLQRAEVVAPLTLHHHAARTVESHLADQLVVSVAHRRRAAAVGLALWAAALLALTPALGRWGPLLSLVVAVGAAALLLGPTEQAGAGVKGVASGALAVHLAWAGLLWTVSAGLLPGVMGAGAGLLVAGALTSWSRPGVREWALVPALTGAVLVLSGMPALAGWPVDGAAVTSGAALVMLAGAGLTRVWLVDVALLRRGPVGEPGRGGEITRERVVSAGRLLLALDAAVLVVWCCATPSLVTGPSSAVLLWGSAVGLMLLRARSESLLARAVMAWSSGGVLLCFGLGVALLGDRSAAWEPRVAWTLTAAVLLCLAPLLSVMGGRVASAHAARAASAAEFLLRLAAPSLWVVQSGLLPGPVA